MEVADLSYLQAADLVAQDERSSHDGMINVHADCDLGSTVIAMLDAHTRLYIFETRELDDGTKRALIMLEGSSAPLGWATAITADGIPLIYMFARPLYEVGKRALKVRRQFEQTSKFVRQLTPGTRLHITETRRTTAGAQRVCVVVIGEFNEAGWVTAKHPNGKRTVAEVKGLSSNTSRGGRRSPESERKAPSSPRSKYEGMSNEALETAAVEFISQLGSVMPSTSLVNTATQLGNRAAELSSSVAPLELSVLQGGEKPLTVELGEILQNRTQTVEQMMTEFSVSRTDSRQDGKADKMEFRMYMRTLLDQQGMLSNMVGANEIDNLFPTLDVDGSGSIDVQELSKALETLEEARAAHHSAVMVERSRSDVFLRRQERVTKVADLTRTAEEAVMRREVELKKSLGAQLGDLLAKKDLVAKDVAKSWTKDGPVEKAMFRRECEARGWKADGSDIDRIFERLVISLGAKSSPRDVGGALDAAKLEQGLGMLMQDAEDLKPTLRRLNMEIIEMTKSVKIAQAEHKQLMMVEDQEALASEEESRQREEKRRLLKEQAAAGAAAKGPTKGKKGKNQKKR